MGSSDSGNRIVDLRAPQAAGHLDHLDSLDPQDAADAAALGAAEDRVAAARDRQLAAQDRLLAADYLRRTYRDSLTGALQRDAGTDQLQHEVARARRTDVPLVVAFLDVVGLKRTNDTRGHSAGDAVLRAVGTVLLETLRPYDLVVRWGGDEFVCALPGSVRGLARERFDQVRRILARGHIDISVGLTELRPQEGLVDAIARADRELYAARRLRS